MKIFELFLFLNLILSNGEFLFASENICRDRCHEKTRKKAIVNSKCKIKNQKKPGCVKKKREELGFDLPFIAWAKRPVDKAFAKKCQECEQLYDPRFGPCRCKTSLFKDPNNGVGTMFFASSTYPWLN